MNVTLRRVAVAGLCALAACSSSSAEVPPSGGADDGGTGPGASSSGSPTSGTDSGAAPLPPIGSGLGPAVFAAGDLDAPSNGGTITFSDIGAPGWYPEIRDPAVGPCDADQTSTCCRGKKTITGNALTPWDEDLIMTLRGPLTMKQLAVYQPGSDGSWSLVSGWDDRAQADAKDLYFEGNATKGAPFAGSVGSECLVNVSAATTFPCGTGSNPYCPTPQSGKDWHQGFSGSKLFVLLAKMTHSTGVPGQCSSDNTGNWYDAPWLGLSVGELVRAGSFSSCQCYAKDPAKGYLADGCGQFNVFEVVNDNNSSKNLSVFSTNFIGYAGYVGEGPCGAKCNPAGWSPALDLVDKNTDLEAAAGATSNPMKGPRAAFRRNDAGYRYFVIALDVATRTVQLGIVHPQKIPTSLAPLLPALPASVTRADIDSLLATRLPR